jgi:DNA-binding response OmpR family regulator
LRVYMTHLRKKIDSSERGEKLLRTESGIGYRLVIPSKRNHGKV